MNKKIYWIIITVCVLIVCTNVYAGLIDEVFKQANDFVTVDELKNASNSTDNVGGALATLISGGSLNIVGLIQEVGNVAIFCVSMFLGVKYVYSGVEGKADIKSSLPNYVVGVIFFYLASAVTTFSQNIIIDALDGGTSFKKFENNIYSMVDTIATVCILLGVVLLGLKYMMPPADSKADVKKQLFPILVGLLIAFNTEKVLLLIVSLSKSFM